MGKERLRLLEEKGFRSLAQLAQRNLTVLHLWASFNPMHHRTVEKDEFEGEERELRRSKEPIQCLRLWHTACRTMWNKGP